jgi:hypothetical protein
VKILTVPVHVPTVFLIVFDWMYLLICVLHQPFLEKKAQKRNAEMMACPWKIVGNLDVQIHARMPYSPKAGCTKQNKKNSGSEITLLSG